MKKDKREIIRNKKIKNMLQLELGILCLVLILFLAIKCKITSLLPSCYIYKTFGILCPSCGGTRCVIHFMLGNFKESFFYHPIFFITILYLIGVNLLYIINSFRKKEILTFLYPKTKFWIIFLILLLIFTIVRQGHPLSVP